MTSTNLEGKLKETLKKVTDKFGNIPLRNISTDSNIPTACISMEDHSMKVNPDFIETLMEKINLEDALEGVIDHEVGHYLFHPHSLKRIIREHLVAKELENGKQLQGFYDDVNNNIRVLLSQENSPIPEVYKALNPESKVEKVLSNLYQDYTNRDFEAPELNQEENEALEKLKTINFLNYDQETGDIEFVKSNDPQNLSDLRKFIRIMDPLIKQDQENETEQKTQDGEDLIDSHSGKQIRKALKELVQEGTIGKEDVKDFADEHSDKMKEENGNFPGGKYNGDPSQFANRFVYESLSLKYNITLKKTPLISSEGFYPTGYSKFESGDSLEDLDVFNSLGGKIIPGLSHKFVKEKVSYHGKKKATPNLLLLLDDSGSMPNPNETISQAVLGSFVVSREYAANGAEIEVGLFSDRTKMYDPSKNLHQIFDHLTEFKNGGDTNIDLNELRKNTSRKASDYLIITDGNIRNREEVIGYLNEQAKFGARAYLIQIGNEEKSFYEGNVKVFNINNPNQLANIVLDDVGRGKK